MKVDLPNLLSSQNDQAAVLGEGLTVIAAPSARAEFAGGWEPVVPKIAALQSGLDEVKQRCGSAGDVVFLVRDVPGHYIFKAEIAPVQASTVQGVSRSSLPLKHGGAEGRDSDSVTATPSELDKPQHAVWTESSLRDAQLHASGRQSAFPAPEVKPMVQAELLVDVQVETAKREEDGRLVQQLLYDYHCVPRKLIWFDDADRRIVNGAHDPIWVRAQLVAPPLFGGLEMRNGGAQYGERLLGALEPLPLFKPMFVVGKVIALRPPQLRELEISLKRLVTPEHTGAMRELLDQANGRPLRVKVQSDELGRRLALYWNRGTVRFKLRLNRSLRADARYEVVIEDAYLEGLCAEKHARLIEDCARELQRQAPSEKEWVEHTADGQDSAST